jgi:nitroreductase
MHHPSYCAVGYAGLYVDVKYNCDSTRDPYARDCVYLLSARLLVWLDSKMEVYEAIKIRKSVRAYDTKPIPEDVLIRVLEAGRVAPSANNAQPWHFIVVKSLEKREILSKRMFARFLVESPVVVVGCGEMNGKFSVVDVSIAMQQMVLAATAEGLGTCWVGDFNEKIVRDLLKIPEKYSVVCLLTMGYPREKLDLAAKLMRTRSRKKMEDIVSLEEFGNRLN